MPIYEFRCLACGKQFSCLVGMTSESDDLSCPECGSDRAERLVSKFRRGRTEDQRVDEMGERLGAMSEPDSPAAVRPLVRELGQALDDDLADEMEEMFEADMEGGPE